MPEHVAKVRPADATEAERFRSLKGNEIAHMHLAAGAKAAHEVFLPALYAGRFGKTEHQIDAAIRRSLKTLLDGLVCSDDERFMYRLGFEAVALSAKEAALTAVGFAAALNDAADAMNGLNAALLDLSRSAALPTAPHVLAVRPGPACRPLRPGDLGALPTCGGPTPRERTVWQDMITEAQIFPSEGAGRIRGKGEPPAADA